MSCLSVPPFAERSAANLVGLVCPGVVLFGYWRLRLLRPRFGPLSCEWDCRSGSIPCILGQGSTRRYERWSGDLIVPVNSGAFMRFAAPVTLALGPITPVTYSGVV